MKKFRITFICCCIIVLVSALCSCAGGFSADSLKAEEYLRIHIRANSNSKEDQSVKYEVRDLVVNALAPMVANAKTKQEAIAAVKKGESAVNGLIDKHLKEKGFNYAAKIRITNEEFPTRVYNGGELILSSGYYDAVIIELGEAKGENWWCVVYPPLCFTGGENVKYRSVIYDLINGHNKK